MFICVDIDSGGDEERLADDFGGREPRVFDERPRRGERVAPSRARRKDSVAGLDDVSRTREQEAMFGVGDDQNGFEPAEHPVGAPQFGEFDRGSGDVPRVFFEFGFEPFQERHAVRRASRESGQNVAVEELADFDRVSFHDRRAERNLPVSSHCDRAVASNRKDRRRVPVQRETPLFGS